MASWPSSLPIYPQDGTFKETLPKTFVVIQTDTGPPKIRNRSTNAYCLVTGEYVFTAAQLASFKTFYIDTLNEGESEFLWPHPRLGTSATVHFIETPTYSSTDDILFKLNLTLQILT